MKSSMSQANNKSISLRQSVALFNYIYANICPPTRLMTSIVVAEDVVVGLNKGYQPFLGRGPLLYYSCKQGPPCRYNKNKHHPRSSHSLHGDQRHSRTIFWLL